MTFWWFFILTFVSCYIANLSNLLRGGPSPELLSDYAAISSYRDLANQRHCKIVMIKSGATEQYFKSSQVSEHPELFRRFITSGVYVDTIEEGMDLVLKSMPGKYAFLTDSTMATYYTNRGDCSLYMINDPSVATRQYSIVVPINSILRHALDRTLSSLIEKGELEKIIDRWFHSHCSQNVLERKDFEKYTAPEFYPVDMGTFSGALMLLVIGLVFASIVTAIEYVIYRFAESVSKIMFSFL